MGNSEVGLTPDLTEGNRIIAMVAGKYPLWERHSPDIGAAADKNRGLLDAIKNLIEEGSIDANKVDEIVSKFKDYIQFCRKSAANHTFSGYIILGFLGRLPKEKWKQAIIADTRRSIDRPETKSDQESNEAKSLMAIANKLTIEQMLEYAFFYESKGQGNGGGPYYNGFYNYNYPEHSNERIRNFYSRYSTPEHDLDDNLLYTLTSAANGTAQTPMYTAPILFDPGLQSRRPEDTKILAEKYIKILPKYALYPGSSFDQEVQKQIKMLKEQYQL